MISFSEIGVRQDIQDSLAALGFVHPTPIQAQVIPVALGEKRDIVALAQTGTGKTAAFGVPLVQQTDPGRDQIQALVLCPTRELCVQVAGDMTGYAGGTRLGIVAVYGGASIMGQINALRRGAHIIVATPGRLNDMIRRNKVDLSGIQTLVLDEADEMLQMGFQEELNAILDKTPASKNTLLFSATMPSGLARITASYLKNPAEITVGRRNAGAENVQHLYYLVQAKHRYAALKRLADHDPDMYAIVFCRTRLETKEVAENLMRDGYNAEALHGELSQSQRDWVMGRFRNRSLQLLVATDVAARGLDVEDVTHVINYTLPDEDSVYTHRSGRTGRAGKTGISIAIINMREKYKIKEIEKKLGKTFVQGQVPSGADIFKQQVNRHLATIAQVDVDHLQMDPILPDILEILESMDREELIKRFISAELNRFLAYYKNAPDLNVSEKKYLDKSGPEKKYKERAPKFSKRVEKRSEYPKSDYSKSEYPKSEYSKSVYPKSDYSKSDYTKKTAQSPFVRLFINVGKKDGVNPGRLIGQINEISGRSDIRIGKIQIMHNTAVLEAESKYTREVMDAFSHLMINGKPVSAKIAGDQRETEEAPKPFRKRTINRRRSFGR